MATTKGSRRSITRPYELSAALRRLRQEQALTQAQLASRSGTSRQWVNAAENNRLPHGVALVCRLVYELGYQIELVPAPEPEVDLDAHLAAVAGPTATVYDNALGDPQ